MVEALAVLSNQLTEVAQIVYHVDSSASVEPCRFQKPQVVSCEMAKRHREFENVLLQHLWPAADLFVDREQMLVGLLLLSSLFLVLYDEAALVRVEVFEDEAVCKLRVQLRRLH